MASNPRGDPVFRYFLRDLFLMGERDATRLYLIRHAQSHSNTGATAQLMDPGLTTVGRRQARRLAQRLARQGVDAIYSSPIRRARETAQALAKAAGLPVETVAALREVDLGAADSPQPPGPARIEAIRQRIVASASWDAFPGGEGSAAFRRRVVEAFDDIVGCRSGKRVAVVTHFGVIQAYVSHILGLEGDFVFYAFNASVTSIRALGHRRVIWRLNDIAHLDGLPSGFEGIS